MNSGRYFAYIAESYSELPKETVVGDGNSSAGVEPCNTWYLSRNKPEDPALKPGMKYTGFLIVRVDRDVTLMQELRTDGFFARKRRRRQTHISSDPAYGFSEYFDAVYLLPIEAIDGFQGETTSWGAFVLLLLGMLVILLLVASGLMYFLHTRGVIKDFCPRKKPGHVPMTKHTGFQPINVDDLPNEYIIRHRDSDFLFTTEFDALPHYNNFDTTASERRENTRKNRYNDIKAFDITRVKLKGDAGDDYINANFIQGYKGKKTFIAAQGPLDQTVGDFWRMIWEHKVQIVVMVSNLFEKYRVQCSKYWPDEEAVTYENMEVRPVEATYYADYAVRVFELRRPSGVANGNGSLDHHGSAQQQQRQSHIYDSVAGAMAADRTSSRLSAETEFGGRTPDVRTVVQYHYTGWNDYRAPECTTGLLRFLCKLRRLEEFNDSPVVVHCSAGVGRTGTFIAIDGVLDQCIEEGKADVFGFVSTLRRQRNFMVQSLEQYVFVYKALAEWYLFGDTDIEVEKIHEHVARLKDPVVTYKLNGSASSSPGLNHVSTVVKSPRSSRSSASSRSLTTGLEAEFKKLDRSLENGRTSEFAKKDENIMKNRFENVVPFDRNRVILGPMVGHADASYINASVVKGYFYPYILAQDPVNSLTCFDFWRMVSEQNSTSIVMLSCEDDFSLEEKYWPDDMARGKAYGQQPDVAVQLASEEHNPTYTTRKFTMCSSKDKELREVVQFSYHDWPSDSPVPRSTGTLLELIGRVLQRQSFLPDSGPIILHCRDGSGRSGLYCCVSLLLERLKAESRVDVFQTVKSLQAQRPMLLNCLEQYSFCYQSVLDYLESFR
uniref:protein-tyrosine-phosphatase n=1 Tax=Plectus sambesii TaxID=2011161 RepID=A0A914UIX6_9BILA